MKKRKRWALKCGRVTPLSFIKGYTYQLDLIKEERKVGNIPFYDDFYRIPSISVKLNSRTTDIRNVEYLRVIGAEDMDLYDEDNDCFIKSHTNILKDNDPENFGNVYYLPINDVFDILSGKKKEYVFVDRERDDKISLWNGVRVYGDLCTKDGTSILTVRMDR